MATSEAGEAANQGRNAVKKALDAAKTGSQDGKYEAATAAENVHIGSISIIYPIQI